MKRELHMGGQDQDKSCEERLRELELFRWRKGALYNHLKEGCGEVDKGLFSQVIG